MVISVFVGWLYVPIVNIHSLSWCQDSFQHPLHMRPRAARWEICPHCVTIVSQVWSPWQLDSTLVKSPLSKTLNSFLLQGNAPIAASSLRWKAYVCGVSTCVFQSDMWSNNTVRNMVITWPNIPLGKCFICGMQDSLHFMDLNVNRHTLSLLINIFLIHSCCIALGLSPRKGQSPIVGCRGLTRVEK